MRKRFEQQLKVGYVAISDVDFPPYIYKSRDEQPILMRALLHIFTTPELNESIFALLEKKVKKEKKNTGRPGMDLWQVLVLSILRYTLNSNWDRLIYIANTDQLLRQILGVQTISEAGMAAYEFKYQTVIDNVSLIDEQTIEEINNIVVNFGHKLFKKKDEPQLLKADSYVLEKNVHFPTDLNLMWDAMRKCFDTVENIQKTIPLLGWRKLKSIRKDYKSLFRATSQIVFKGKKEDAKKKQAKLYVSISNSYIKRLEQIPNQIIESNCNLNFSTTMLALDNYLGYAKKWADQIERRLIKNEIIPSQEKIYSMFEPEVEWITKGKLNKRVELGHLLLITTNQYHLIVDYKIMEKEKDAAQVKPLIDRLKNKFATQTISSISFDKGFYSQENYQYATDAHIGHVIMPKKGRKNAEEKERENTKEFKKLRNQHSAIESSINMLEHHGGNKCPDKGHKNYKKYVGLCVLSTNLHIIGKELIRQEKETLQQKIRRAA